MKQWYRFQASATDPSVAEIHIIDFIGDWWDDAGNRFWGESIGVTARAFVEELSKLPAAVQTLKVHINSPGGDVQGGINIANALREQGSKGRTVETYIDGIAASIASVIAMAGSKVVMGDNALMMIHDPWTIEIGSAADMRKAADVLDTMRDQIVATYKWHATIDEKALSKMMADESWLSADEALAAGLATEKVEGLKAAASISRAALGRLKVPEQYRARVDTFVEKPPSAPKAATTDEILQMCVEAGLDLAFANTLRGRNETVEQVRARIANEKQARVQAKERETQISALCAAVKLPKRAALYTKSALSIDDIKADLTAITAAIDNTEIDGSLKPDKGKPSTAANLAEVYGKLNRRAKE